MPSAAIGRRGFFRLSTALAYGTLAAPLERLLAQETPEVSRSRATDGDDRREPKWDERLTITVGNKQADLVGDSDKVIQAAVDYMARAGGGTVKLSPGLFTLRLSAFNFASLARRPVAPTSAFPRKRATSNWPATRSRVLPWPSTTAARPSKYGEPVPFPERREPYA